MKKVLLIIGLIASALLISCEKEVASTNNVPVSTGTPMSLLVDEHQYSLTIEVTYTDVNGAMHYSEIKNEGELFYVDYNESVYVTAKYGITWYPSGGGSPTFSFIQNTFYLYKDGRPISIENTSSIYTWHN